MGKGWLCVFFITLAASLKFGDAVSAGNVAAKGCGGFVKSQKNIDFSTIEIVMETQTQNGWRKVGTTDCAPHNGYYFLPIQPSDLASGGGTTNFRLTARPPTGWKIHPEEGVVIPVDGFSDPCSTNKDVNFAFVGFGITGSVLSKDTNSGPSGIKVELLEKSKGDQEEVVKSALTGQDGSYVFFGVLPGVYNIRVSKEAQDLYSFEKTTQDIEVGDSEGRSNPFIISGYSIMGRVSASNLKGSTTSKLSGIEVTLFSGEKALAKTKTDLEGAYKFPNVAVGQFLIRVDGEGSNLELIAGDQSVTLGHSHLEVADFSVSSYSLTGQVATSMASGHRPLPGVSIKATTNQDGAHYQVKTDKDGKFALKSVKSFGSLTVKATLDGYDFETSTFDSIGPDSSATLTSTPIVPKRYRLSGKVDRSSLPPELEIKVKFGGEGEVLVNDKGSFSLYLPEGSYDVSVEVKTGGPGGDALASRGIGFAPVKQTVRVSDSPVADINFQPIKATVAGVVTVLNQFSSDSALEVTLKSKDRIAGGEVKKQTIRLDKKSGSTKSSGKFVFSNVLPGTYIMSVASSGSSNRICWSKPVQEVTVSSDISDIAFEQLGFYAMVESPHPTTLIINNKSSGSQESALKRGVNKVCVENKNWDGVAGFTLSTRGCEKFEITPNAIDSNAADVKIVLKPTHYQVSGRIFSKESIPKLELNVKSEVRAVKLKTTREDSRGFYSFTFDALPNEEISFVPTSEEFLFDPENIHVFVQNSCHLDAVHFDAVGGFFLRGQISPPVENVKVSVASSGARVNEMAAATTHSDASGSFRLGPLPQETEESGKYRIQAVKEGYVFEEVSQGKFSSKKLAAIVVKVASDASGAEDKRLSGAVVSVSGGGNSGSNVYRSNTHTDKSGEAHFLSLSPGEYFVKPQLKEFEFSPKHNLININEGQTSTVNFEAKRVAFSAFGKIRSINGEPESGINIRAKQTKCAGGHASHQSTAVEEATSDAKGAFRFRGLVPGCEYSIGLDDEADSAANEVTGGDIIERLIPSETLISMGSEDSHLKDSIVAFRAVNIMDVTMVVTDEANANSEAPVKVVMTDHQAYSYTVKRIIGEMITLPAVAKEPGKKYTISVETFPEKYTPKRKVSTVILTDEYYKFVNVTIPSASSGSAKESSAKAQTASNKKAVAFLVLVLGLLAAYVYRDSLPGLIQAMSEKFTSSPSSSGKLHHKAVGDVDSGSGGGRSSSEDGGARKRIKKAKLVS